MKDQGPVKVPHHAAAYVRMSTEHQQYSTSNQMDVIRDYARRRQLEIVKEYSDEGKSGLNIQGRDSLARMIRDVQDGCETYTCILVYDVSRWGRFQDADESAYYEYICRRAGVLVHYCAEQFENDGSPVATIVKGVKRAMAGEYSRELSSKVFQGACRLIQLGFKQGGTSGYGLRRMLVDQSGRQKGQLRIGEQKSLQTDRVILVPGPPDEVEHVRWMYRQFACGTSESNIADALNSQGIRTDFGRPWTPATVRQVLTNEKYIGNNVYHRTSFKLKRKHVTNPPEQWIRANGAFEGLVPRDLFDQVQQIFKSRSEKLSDEEMLGHLRRVLARNGRLSGILIDEDSCSLTGASYHSRFGSLVTAYRLIGYDPGIDYSFIEINRRLRARHCDLVVRIIREIESRGVVVRWDDGTHLLHINEELRVSIVICRHRSTGIGNSRWLIRLDSSLKPDLTIAVRMDATNDAVRDYYILPGIDMTWERLRLAECNGIHLDAYQTDTLDYFFLLADRIQLPEAA